MAPGLRTFLVIFSLGQVFALWWMAGQYSGGDVPAAEPKPQAKPSVFISNADKPAGKFWGNEGGKTVIEWDGVGAEGTGRAITIRFEGAGWRG